MSQKVHYLSPKTGKIWGGGGETNGFRAGKGGDQSSLTEYRGGTIGN